MPEKSARIVIELSSEARHAIKVRALSLGLNVKSYLLSLAARDGCVLCRTYGTRKRWTREEERTLYDALADLLSEWQTSSSGVVITISKMHVDSVKEELCKELTRSAWLQLSAKVIQQVKFPAEIQWDRNGALLR